MVPYETLSDKIKAWYRALVTEHNLVNTLWLNLHPVDERLFRSAQPTPWQLKKLIRRHGIRTVINLRGEQPKSPVYQFEKKVCDEMGVALENTRIFSRSVVEARFLRDLKKIFEACEYPALMHCKAGADRSSLAAVFYLHWVKGWPIKKAYRKEVRFWPFGYIRRSGAGIIAYYFEAFIAYEKEHPEADIVAWTETLDRDAMKEGFEKSRKSSLVDLFYEKILRRE